MELKLSFIFECFLKQTKKTTKMRICILLNVNILFLVNLKFSKLDIIFLIWLFTTSTLELILFKIMSLFHSWYY